MRVVERVAGGPAKRATAKAVLVEMLDHRCMSQLVVALERQQVVTSGRQDLLGNATKVDVAVHALNRMLELGRPISVRVA